MTSQSQITLSPPRWGGFHTRHQVGGAALIAFGLVLWALFLGTVGAPVRPPVDSSWAASSGESTDAPIIAAAR